MAAVQALQMEPARVELVGSRYNAVWPESISSEAPIAHVEQELVALQLGLATGTMGSDVPPGLPPPPGIPSHGSLLHAVGGCRPCAWFWQDAGCQNGINCRHCHLCPPGAVKESKRLKRSMKARAAAQFWQMQRAQSQQTGLMQPLQFMPPAAMAAMMAQHLPFAPPPTMGAMSLHGMDIPHGGCEFAEMSFARQPTPSPRSSEGETTIGSSSDSNGDRDRAESSAESEDGN